MKEMVYCNEEKREMLDTGYCMGFFYYIMSLGTHPVAYIRIPESHKYYKKDYTEIKDIDVHGGLTYSSDVLWINNVQTHEGWFIGWDYGHMDDYMGFFENTRWQDSAKKWTVEEIMEDVASACYQLSQVKVKREGKLVEWIKRFFKKH